jgi:uncharacterized protein with HEPN domain
MSRDQQSILDIIDSINLILEYTQGIDWGDLNIKDQDAIILRFIIIGEATKRLSPELRDRHPQIPWRQMAGLRDVVVHEYDDINLEIIQDIAELELPAILPLLQRLTDIEFTDASG